MSKSSSTHLCNFAAKCCNHRCKNKRSLISNTTCTVLVYFNSINIRQIQLVSAVFHCKRQVKSLIIIHISEIYCHKKCRSLIIRYIPPDIAINKELYLFFSKLSTISFLLYNIDHSHNADLLNNLIKKTLSYINRFCAKNLSQCLCYISISVTCSKINAMF